MRVLMIANNFPWPSAPTNGIFNLAQAHALEARGHEIFVVRPSARVPRLYERRHRYGSAPERYAVDGIPVRTLRGLVGPRSWGVGTLGAQLARELAREIERVRPDIIHAQGLMPAGIVARASGLRYIVTGHGSESYRLPWMRPGLARTASAVVRDAAAVTAVSAFVGAHLERLGARVVRVIHNGADEERFHPADRGDARARLRIERTRAVIAFVGDVEPYKGIAELADALGQLRDLRPLIVVAGEGSRAAWFARRCEDARMLGTVDHARIAEVYAAADAVVLPSHGEGLPVSLCEAMHVGRAIVATRLPGIAELGIEGESGRLVPVGDARALATALREVLTDAPLRARFEIHARAFALAHLRWSQNAAAYDALYRELIAQPTGATA